MRYPRKTKKALKKWLTYQLISANEIKRLKSLFPHDPRWVGSITYRRRGTPWILSVSFLRYKIYQSACMNEIFNEAYKKILNEWLAGCQLYSFPTDYEAQRFSEHFIIPEGDVI